MRLKHQILSTLLLFGISFMSNNISIAQEKIQDSLALEKRSNLQKLEKILSDNQEKTKQLREEIELLSREKNRLQNALIDSAEKLRKNENELEKSQSLVTDIEQKLLILNKENDAKKQTFAEILSAALTIGANPLPAVLIAPEDAIKTLKTSILLETMLPELKTYIEDHTLRVFELSQTQKEYVQNQKELAQNMQNFSMEKQRLDALFTLRESTLTNRVQELDLLQKQAQEFANEAKTLRELLNKLDKNTPNTAFQRSNVKSFVDLKGALILPARGQVIRHFGQEDNIGGKDQGLTLKTNTEGVITSPLEGQVLFVGPFRSYGYVVILNAGQGYHILLAGLSKSIVEIGQHVLSGEPIGRLGIDKQGGQLYIEFRKNSEVFDPFPWFAQSREIRSSR